MLNQALPANPWVAAGWILGSVLVAYLGFRGVPQIASSVKGRFHSPDSNSPEIPNAALVKMVGDMQEKLEKCYREIADLGQKLATAHTRIEFLDDKVQLLQDRLMRGGHE